MLLTLYTNKNNPDNKAIVAYNVMDGELVWWNNDFSVQTLGKNSVIGFSEKYGKREQILDLLTGKTIEVKDLDFEKSRKCVAPAALSGRSPYFETVKTFLNQKFNLLPITALEYLEYDSLIFISCYLQENDLANYLFIMSADGNLLLKEKLDEHLKGIGLDTFFILSGCVFFVRNKVELVSYKIL